MKLPEFKENAFDLLRLLAASQVMVLHSFEFTMVEVTGALFFDILRLFPGVPIFFFISGYLISRAYERSPSLLSYWENRILRIFPALIVCVFFNLILVWLAGYFNAGDTSFIDIVLLFFAKVTAFQFYNPDFMRNFGDGVLNGSLWTICVELQFYSIVPLMYYFLRINPQSSNLILVVSIILFIIANRLLYIWGADYSDSVIWKLYRVSFIPWLYMFLFGVFVQKNYKWFIKLAFKIKAYLAVIVYLTTMLTLSHIGVEFSNSIPPYVYFPLALLVFRLAYSEYLSNLTKIVLRGNDISYGIYIWHMVFLNQFIYITSGNVSIWQVILAIFLTISSAIISWVTIEKPALRMKKYSLHKL